MAKRNVKLVTNTKGLPGTLNVKAGSDVLAVLFHASKSTQVTPNPQGAIWAFTGRKDALQFASLNGGTVKTLVLKQGKIGEVGDMLIEVIGYDKDEIRRLRNNGFIAVINNGQDVGGRGEQWVIVNPTAILK
jgi:hypothetical protein